jgi:hypothetical protein
MAVDMRRIALAAVNAAFDQQEQSAGKAKRSRLSGMRPLLIGAGLMTAGRVALSGRGRGLLDSLEGRLTELVDQDADRDAGLPPEEDEGLGDEEFDEPEAEEEPDAYDEEEEEPEAYEGEDEEDEDVEEPEDYEDEDDYADDGDEDEEPEEETDERRERTTTGSRRRPRS